MQKIGAMQNHKPHHKRKIKSLLGLLAKMKYKREIKPTVKVWALALVAQTVKNPPANAGDQGSNPGVGRSPGEGNGYPI